MRNKTYLIPFYTQKGSVPQYLHLDGDSLEKLAEIGKLLDTANKSEIVRIAIKLAHAVLTNSDLEGKKAIHIWIKRESKVLLVEITDNYY